MEISGIEISSREAILLVPEEIITVEISGPPQVQGRLCPSAKKGSGREFISATNKLSSTDNRLQRKS